MKQTSQRDAARSEGKNGIRYTSLPCKIILGRNKVMIRFDKTMKTYTKSGGIAPLILHIGTGWRFVVTIMLRPRF